jgi:hypothetical protein
MKKKIIGVFICLLCLVSSLITSAISLDTTTVSNENKINEKDNLSKEIEYIYIQSGYIFANAIIDTAYYLDKLHTYIGSYHVKNIFFIGSVIIGYDDNTYTRLPLMIRNVQKPYLMGGKIFIPLTVSDDYVRFSGRVVDFEIFTTPFGNN